MPGFVEESIVNVHSSALPAIRAAPRVLQARTCVALVHQQMATSTPSVTPRLRVTRHPPVPYDRSIHTSTSTSEAAPSRLRDVSQLVNVTLNGIDMSDDNIYASDVPTEKTIPQAPPRIETPSTVTQKDNPAAVLRALLSRLPNRDGSPTRVNDKDAEYQYPSEKESDYDIETASATTSVAQSSLKNIFNKALREPGDTPRKDRSHRRRSSSIGATDMEDTPHIVEARDIKGKRRSLSDDEVESASSKFHVPFVSRANKIKNHPHGLEHASKRLHSP